MNDALWGTPMIAPRSLFGTTPKGSLFGDAISLKRRLSKVVKTDQLNNNND